MVTLDHHSTLKPWVVNSDPTGWVEVVAQRRGRPDGQPPADHHTTPELDGRSCFKQLRHVLGGEECPLRQLAVRDCEITHFSSGEVELVHQIILPTNLSVGRQIWSAGR